ncbi:MAG TPA: DUF1015 domain-containing protein [Trebonia sp.]|nr:DUF1015 domain-containing protein [Trebonia sp.]
MRTLPSSPDSGTDPGLALLPFRGIRYAPDHVSAIADVTSPPYDVIGTGTLDELLAAEPHNIVRLILPGGDAAAAAASLRAWLRSGVLVRDAVPALYIYQQNGPGFLQRGLIGLVGVGGPAIHPHENVMPGPVAGRRELMAATEANLEPIFLVYNGSGGSGSGGSASGLVDEVATREQPFLETVTSDGVTHRLWRVTDPAAHASVAADLAGRTALIADGHHRYAAYEQLRTQLRSAGHGDGPWDYGLAFLVDADAYPPRLGAIHRVLPGLPFASAVSRASAGFTVRELPDDFEAATAGLTDAARGGPAFLLAGRGGFRLLDSPDPARLASVMPADTSQRWRSLDAAVLQELLLADVWGIRDNEHDVLISHDAHEAVSMARDADGTAVVCNPVPFPVVREIAAHGECVPRKSTSFGPKPRTGLVLRTFGG